MNTYTFRRTDAWRDQANRKGGRPARLTINFRDRYIFLSTELAAMLGVDTNAHVAFTYDEDNPKRVYIRTADAPDDAPDIKHSLSGSGRNGAILRCSNKAVTQHVLRHAGATKSCTCFVARKPTRIDGKDHFMIMLSCPMMTK